MQAIYDFNQVMNEKDEARGLAIYKSSNQDKEFQLSAVESK